LRRGFSCGEPAGVFLLGVVPRDLFSTTTGWVVCDRISGAVSIRAGELYSELRKKG
jgi:hypothetical protein